ncbi:MAG: NUDIX domain-containing protein [Nanoarchaeota archaeon]|nr:NUDIX domain-containing protein [Nanoarchaeota archaeon]
MPEIYDVVNENDEVIGKATRKECHEKQLIHRLVQIYVVKSDGSIVLQKRAAWVDTFPNLLTAAGAGHVDSGETYETAAARELKEETGLSVSLKKLGPAKSYEPEHMQNLMVFSAQSDGPFVKSKEATEFVIMTLDEAKMKMKKEPEAFTPACRVAFKVFLENLD